MCFITSTTIDPCDCCEIDPCTDAQRENDSLLASCPSDDFELDAWNGEIPFDQSAAEIGQQADTNFWLAGEYERQGATALAEECRQAAQALYSRWTLLSELLSCVD